MEFDLNDSQASYSPSSSSTSTGSRSVWSNQEVEKSKPCEKISDRQFGYQDHEDSDCGLYKWMLSKTMCSNRIDRGSDSVPKFDDHKPTPLEDVDHNQSKLTQKSNLKNSKIVEIRVCSECNTTKTPLWRRGPKGPKSLCNACGIRQRKATRAMAAAASSDGSTAVPLPSPPLKKKLKVHKNKRLKTDLLLNKRLPHEEKFIGFEDFTTSILSLGLEKVFPQDEKGAAILLMALSCGLVCSR